MIERDEAARFGGVSRSGPLPPDWFEAWLRRYIAEPHPNPAEHFIETLRQRGSWEGPPGHGRLAINRSTGQSGHQGPAKTESPTQEWARGLTQAAAAHP
jgi:hypothetical protein